MDNNSHKTAITRKKPSVPVKWLVDHTDIKDLEHVLDYGCGKGFDAIWFNFDQYDPYYYDLEPKLNCYDAIICVYVLNVIEDPIERISVLQHIQACLKLSGVAYIVVRRDIKKEGFTSKRTWQGTIKLHLDKIRETSTYCIYKLTKTSEII